jgi:hypothetical protein
MKPIEILKTLKLNSDEASLAFPQQINDVAVGQIRSIEFLNEEELPERRFVLITAIAGKNSMVAQAMLIGIDFVMASKNDVLLLDDERPSLDARVIQTDLRFPVLCADLGAIYSNISLETRELLYKMSNFSGREVSRAGLHRNNSHLLRQDYVREEMSVVRFIYRNALTAMAGPEYKASKVRELDIDGLEVSVAEIINNPWQPIPTAGLVEPKTKSEKREKIETLLQLKSQLSQRELVAA